MKRKPSAKKCESNSNSRSVGNRKHFHFDSRTVKSIAVFSPGRRCVFLFISKHFISQKTISKLWQETKRSMSISSSAGLPDWSGFHVTHRRLFFFFHFNVILKGALT